MSNFNHAKYKSFPPVNLTNRTWPDKVISEAPIWNSVDLRDGNQALIEPMTIEQKLRFFKLLVKVGFKEIEIGFPSASSADFDFARLLINENLIPDDVVIQAITQAREDLIDRTYQALEGAKQAIMLIYNSTSKVQLEQVYGFTEDEVIDQATAAARLVVKKSAAYPQTRWQFHYGLESFTGTDLDFAVRLSDAVSDVWQPTPDNKMIMSLPATVEMSTPNVFADQVEYFCTNIQRRENIIISVHTHNDRGTGVAAAELGRMAGADRIEGTLLGNGERTGNMDIVVMAMNLYSQGVDPRLDLSIMDEVIACVDHCTKIKLHPRHPYVGELVYSAFAGGHQHAIHKCLNQRKEGDLWEVAYLPIDPKDLGRSYQELIRINSQSGKGGISYVIEHHVGVTMPRWLQLDFRQLVQNYADQDGGELSPDLIWQIFESHYLDIDSALLNQVQQDMVTLKAQANMPEGDHIDFKSDSFHRLLKSLYQMDIEILSIHSHQLFEEQDKDYFSCVQLSCHSHRAAGVAINSCGEQAGLMAIVSGIHKHLALWQAEVVA